MTYDTINDEESTPLKIQGGYSDDATGVAPSSTKKPTSSTIVRALMVGTAVGALLLMAGPSKMMTTMNKSSNVDGMVVVSSTETSNDDFHECHVPPYEEAFSGLSCKNGGDTRLQNKDGYCAGGGESFGAHPAMMHYETCYVSQNGYCWSRSYKKTISCNGWLNLCTYGYYRCDPQGYSDGSDGYEKDGFWHVTAPRSDGSCGRPCRKFSSYDGH